MSVEDIQTSAAADRAQAFSIRPVAIAHTPFHEKFGIPRQSNLISIPAQIELLAPFNAPESVVGLEQVSHIWLSFIFNANQHESKSGLPRLSVRPPRLGGNKKMGVFATRASFRPNGIGQSLVKLDAIDASQGHVVLHVSGVDLLDKTPIIDIKPYLPYADAVANAHNHIAPKAPTKQLAVIWHDTALEQLTLSNSAIHDVAITKQWIEDLISLDPRPAYKRSKSDGNYAMAVLGYDVCWQMQACDRAVILSIKPL